MCHLTKRCGTAIVLRLFKKISNINDLRTIVHNHMAAKKTKTYPFVKMYATGNDFVVFNGMKSNLVTTSRLTRGILNRTTGIGGDQLLIIGKSRLKGADFRMQAFNPDGSEAEMCGNGIRCVTKHLFDKKLTKKKQVMIETLGGIREGRLEGKMYRINMGPPQLKGKEIGVNLSGRIINRPLRMEGREFRITCCGMGNPHCVVFVEDPANFAVEKFGPQIETYHAFPRRVNVEFAEPISRKEINMRVWERGTGETQGCGTGACAVAVAGVLNGHTDRDVSIKMPGGTVKVTWERKSNEITLSGPASVVYEGSIEI